MTQRKLKKILYKKEIAFAEAYDRTDTYNEIIVSGAIKMGKNTEKIQVTYVNQDRILQPKTITAGSKGELNFTKPISKALMDNHKTLISNALGRVVDNSMLPTIDAKQPQTVGEEAISIIGEGSIANAHFINLDVDDFLGAELSIGKRVSIILDLDGSGNMFAFPYNEVGKVDDIGGGEGNVHFKYPVKDTTIAKIQEAITNGRVFIKAMDDITLGVTDQDSFTFVLVFQDDTVEVFRGCGITAKMKINQTGAATIDFSVKGAIVSNKPENCLNTPENFYGNPNAVIIDEPGTLPVVYNFCWLFVEDLTKDPNYPIHISMVKLDVDINNTIKELNRMAGGSNRIGGYIVEGSVTAKAEMIRSEEYIELFGKRYESSNLQDIALSQNDFGLFSPANFSNETTGSTGEEDTTEYNLDLNFDGNRFCYLILPATYGV